MASLDASLLGVLAATLVGVRVATRVGALTASLEGALLTTRVASRLGVRVATSLDGMAAGVGLSLGNTVLAFLVVVFLATDSPPPILSGLQSCLMLDLNDCRRSMNSKIDMNSM